MEMGASPSKVGCVSDCLLHRSITNTFLSPIDEELGWRGYLLPHLCAIGLWRAALLCGLLWGLWHAPFMLLTDLPHAGENLWITIPLFLLSTTMAGMFFGYLRFRTGSIWPAALAHTAHNVFWALGRDLTPDASPLVNYLAGDAGLLFTLGYALIGSWLLYQLTEHAAFPIWWQLRSDGPFAT